MVCLQIGETQTLDLSVALRQEFFSWILEAPP